MLLTALIASAGTSLSAQEKVDYTGTHEVDVSVGASSIRYLTLFESLGHGFDYDGTTTADETILPTFKAEYGYNIVSWLNIGAGANYSYSKIPLLYTEDNSPAWDERIHFANVTFNIKFYWLNRKWIRMYSGIGVGVGFLMSDCSGRTDGGPLCETHVLPAFDVRLLGLTVGQKLYGRLEIGTLYGFVTAGIGYRF